MTDTTTTTRHAIQIEAEDGSLETQYHTTEQIQERFAGLSPEGTGIQVLYMGDIDATSEWLTALYVDGRLMMGGVCGSMEELLTMSAERIWPAAARVFLFEDMAEQSSWKEVARESRRRWKIRDHQWEDWYAIHHEYCDAKGIDANTHSHIPIPAEHV